MTELPLTRRLPLEQYWVTIHKWPGSIHAPMKRLMLSCASSFIRYSSFLTARVTCISSNRKKKHWNSAYWSTAAKPSIDGVYKRFVEKRVRGYRIRMWFMAIGRFTVLSSCTTRWIPYRTVPSKRHAKKSANLRKLSTNLPHDPTLLTRYLSRKPR